MALMDIIKKPADKPADINKLNSQEIQLILQILKQATIKGESIESFYNLIVKLQNQYLEQTNQ